ncbi:MAG: HEPN domain-containing protein [Nanoarchaeota archaeon]
MVSVKDLFEERKLRKVGADLGKSKQSVIISEKKLKEANELFKSGFYEQSILSAYTSMFHIARAFLYKDGIQEKSHYAVYVYLKEKHSNLISTGLLESFLNHQSERKEILYGFDYSADKDEAKLCIEDAEAFYEQIVEILK